MVSSARRRAMSDSAMLRTISQWEPPAAASMQDNAGLASDTRYRPVAGLSDDIRRRAGAQGFSWNPRTSVNALTHKLSKKADSFKHDLDVLESPRWISTYAFPEEQAPVDAKPVCDAGWHRPQPPSTPSPAVVAAAGAAASASGSAVPSPDKGAAAGDDSEVNGPPREDRVTKMGRQVSEIQRKDLLIAKLRDQRGDLQVTLIDKRTDVKKSTTKHTRVMQTLEDTQDMFRSLQLRYDSARNVTRNKRSQFDNLTARLHAAKDKLAMREGKARRLRENISALDADIIGCHRQAEVLKSQLSAKDDEFSSLQDAIAMTDDTARVKLTEIAQHQLQYANYHNKLERDVINARDLGKQLEDTMELKGKKATPGSPKKRKKHK